MFAGDVVGVNFGVFRYLSKLKNEYSGRFPIDKQNSIPLVIVYNIQKGLDIRGLIYNDFILYRNREMEFFPSTFSPVN